MASPSVDTRNEAYHSIDNITDKQQAVLAVLRVGPMSDKAIAKKLGWEINRVTPRRGELVEMGLVRAAYKDTDAVTRKSCIVWAISEGDKASGDHEPAIKAQACEGVND